MDSQAIEIIGRNRLVTELLLAGLEVAAPLRDHGIDLIAYLDLDEEIKRFVAIPIQMKAASARGFSIDRKYDRFHNLVIAFVWGMSPGVESVTYAVTHRRRQSVSQPRWDTPRLHRGRTRAHTHKHGLLSG